MNARKESKSPLRRLLERWLPGRPRELRKKQGPYILTVKDKDGKEHVIFVHDF